jgi:hypothetical protein
MPKVRLVMVVVVLASLIKWQDERRRRAVDACWRQIPNKGVNAASTRFLRVFPGCARDACRALM